MPAVRTERPYQHLWESIRSVLWEQRQHRALLAEELSFFIYRSDTNAVLARGIFGYEEAKRKADQIRKARGLSWSVVKFKAERKVSQPQAAQSSQLRFGVSGDGRTFTNARGQTSRVEYSNRYNPSKRGRFRGYTDSDGNYHDID